MHCVINADLSNVTHVTRFICVCSHAAGLERPIAYRHVRALQDRTRPPNLGMPKLLKKNFSACYIVKKTERTTFSIRDLLNSTTRRSRKLRPTFPRPLLSLTSFAYRTCDVTSSAAPLLSYLLPVKKGGTGSSKLYGRGPACIMSRPNMNRPIGEDKF